MKDKFEEFLVLSFATISVALFSIFIKAPKVLLGVVLALGLIISFYRLSVRGASSSNFAEASPKAYHKTKSFISTRYIVFSLLTVIFFASLYFGIRDSSLVVFLSAFLSIGIIIFWYNFLCKNKVHRTPKWAPLILFFLALNAIVIVGRPLIEAHGISVG